MASEGLVHLKQLLTTRAALVSPAINNSVCGCCGSYVVSDKTHEWDWTKGINLANTEHKMHTGDNYIRMTEPLPDHPDVLIKHVNLKDTIGVDLQYTIAIQQGFNRNFRENQENKYVRKPAK